VKGLIAALVIMVLVVAFVAISVLGLLRPRESPPDEGPAMCNLKVVGQLGYEGGENTTLKPSDAPVLASDDAGRVDQGRTNATGIATLRVPCTGNYTAWYGGGVWELRAESAVLSGNNTSIQAPFWLCASPPCPMPPWWEGP